MENAWVPRGRVLINLVLSEQCDSPHKMDCIGTDAKPLNHILIGFFESPNPRLLEDHKQLPNIQKGREKNKDLLV